MTSPIHPDQHDWKKGGRLRLPADVRPGKPALWLYSCKKCGHSTAAQYQPSRNAKVKLKVGEFTCDEYLARRIHES